MALTPELAILIAVTLGQVLLAIDGWVHRRERKEAALEYQASGRASLQSQIDGLAEAVSRQTQLSEQLRLERASHLATELADIHRSIAELGRKASDRGNALQVLFGKFGERLSVLESNVNHYMGGRRGSPHDD